MLYNRNTVISPSRKAVRDELLLGGGLVLDPEQDVSIIYDPDLDELAVEFAGRMCYFENDIEAAISYFFYCMRLNERESYQFSRHYWRTTVAWLLTVATMIFYTVFYNYWPLWMNILYGVFFLFALRMAYIIYDHDKKMKKLVDSMGYKV